MKPLAERWRAFAGSRGLGARAWVPVAILAAGALAVAVMVATREETLPEPRERPAPLVRAVEVTPADVQFVVRAQGTVVPRTESDLVAQVAGEVVWVSPHLVSGGFVEPGEALVRIERTDYEADLESARAALARAESEFRRARTERRRQQQLADRSVASQSRIDDAENAFRVAEATLREGRARVVRAERDLERTTLVSPFEGRVRSERVDVGQFVARGQSLATAYAVDYAEVRLPLPDRELRFLDLPLEGRLRATPPAGTAASGGDADAGDAVAGDAAAAGQPDGDAEAEIDATGAEAPGPEVVLRAEFAGAPRTWLGHVVRTEGEIDPKSRMVNVVARVKDPYGRRRPPEADGVPLAVGLFVDADILGRTAPAAVVLPRSALREHRGRAGVYVVDDESRLRFRPVEVLRTERERVVIGEGLAAGERVNVSPLVAIVDGMRVKLVEDATPDVARADAATESAP